MRKKWLISLAVNTVLFAFNFGLLFAFWIQGSAAYRIFLVPGLFYIAGGVAAAVALRLIARDDEAAAARSRAEAVRSLRP